MSVNPFHTISLGPAKIPSPIVLPKFRSVKSSTHQDDVPSILFEPSLDAFREAKAKEDEPHWFELAGPRPRIYFNPAQTKAAIVTCGGLCPGINAVIRALVMQLWHRYGVRNIVGIRYGYQGLGTKAPGEFRELNPDAVESIQAEGGTILGSSRGSPETEEMVDTLERNNINILFVIGGDGTMRGALALSREIAKRGTKISIVGIPKTIDNDIPYVKRSFGFETAVANACQALNSAHVEAKGALRGIGLVKLMGRHSGYVTANAALASGHPNFCLIPEVPFSLDGEGGLCDLVEKRLATRGHCLIVVAEGAGQEYFTNMPERRDASGNRKLEDIGLYMKDYLAQYFAKKKLSAPIRYIDPSYLIRSAPADPADQLFCGLLAQNAVHAAMAGKTAMLIGYWHGRMTHVPMTALEGKQQTINPSGELWFNVLETTGQPTDMGQCVVPR